MNFTAMKKNGIIFRIKEKEVVPMEKRIALFDIAKGILITLVVLGHAIGWVVECGAGNGVTYLEKIINVFHMPAFFVITGVLFNETKWKNKPMKEFVLTRLKTLIVPYLFFELYDSFLQVIIYKIGVDGFLNCLKNMLAVRCNIGADWFLIALFMGEFLYVISVKYTCKKVRWIIALIGMGANVIFKQSHLLTIIGRGLIAYSFILFGNEMNNKFKQKDNYKWRYIIVSLIVVIMIALLNGNISVVSCDINNPALFLIGATSGTYFILGVSNLIRSEFFEFLGKNTLPILGIHQRILFLIPRYYPFWIPFDNLVLCTSIFVCIVFFIEMPVIIFMNKCLPFVIGKSK